jgi:hypothetical protein
MLGDIITVALESVQGEALRLMQRRKRLNHGSDDIDSIQATRSESIDLPQEDE